jgi:hypothetical protein
MYDNSRYCHRNLFYISIFAQHYLHKKFEMKLCANLLSTLAACAASRRVYALIEQSNAICFEHTDESINLDWGQNDHKWQSR